MHRPLPVDAIVQDARTVSVPVYAYPFVHEELWAFAAARARAAASRALPFLRIVPPPELPPPPRHWRNFVMAQDEAGRWEVVRPAQLLVPATTIDGADAAEGTLCFSACGVLYPRPATFSCVLSIKYNLKYHTPPRSRGIRRCPTISQGRLICCTVCIPMYELHCTC